MLQRLIRNAGGDARRHVERAALAVRPARPVGAALELSTGHSAVAAALHARRHTRKGAGGGPRLAPARRADPRSAETAGQRGGRRGPRSPPRPSLCLPPGRWPAEGSARLGSAARERGRDRRIRRRRTAPAGARSVARLCARRAGAGERPYLEPAGVGRASRRSLRPLGRRAGGAAVGSGGRALRWPAPWSIHFTPRSPRYSSPGRRTAAPFGAAPRA